jgi:hypothetical protein
VDTFGAKKKEKKTSIGETFISLSSGLEIRYSTLQLWLGVEKANVLENAYWLKSNAKSEEKSFGMYWKMWRKNPSLTIEQVEEKYAFARQLWSDWLKSDHIAPSCPCGAPQLREEFKTVKPLKTHFILCRAKAKCPFAKILGKRRDMPSCPVCCWQLQTNDTSEDYDLRCLRCVRCDNTVRKCKAWALFYAKI